MKSFAIQMEASATINGIPITRPVVQRLSNKAQWRFYILSLIMSDIGTTSLAFWLAYLIRFRTGLPIFKLEVLPSQPFYTFLALVFIPVWLLIFSILGLYRKDNLLGGTQEYALIFRGASISMLVVVVVSFLDPNFVLSRGWLLLAWLLAFFLTASGRFGLRRLVYALRRKGYFLSPAIVIGANPEGRLLAEQLWDWRTSGLHVVGVVDNHVPVQTAIYRHIHVLGRLDQLEEIIAKSGAEELILATSALERKETLSIFERFGFSKSVNLRLSSGLFEIITTGLQIRELAYVPLVQINNLRLTGIDRVLKLVLDYCMTIPGLILISPLMAIIAVAVKLDSPGPIFYRRRVMGINGKQFNALKFRTMFVDGEEILEKKPHLKEYLEQEHKLKEDPRVTPLGHFLRRYSLDELPQLFNVLFHDMSLVGPRMISPPEMGKYDQWGLNLLTVRPGITGLWQVSGRSDISYQERVRLDMHYIRNWTIWLDIQLLFRTIPAVIKGMGAY